MTRLARTIQSSFTTGEIGPELEARIDVSRYYSGCKLMRNVLVRPQGGFLRRPGMAHIGTIPGGEGGVRLIPFAFNTEQTYVLALTGGAFHVWRSDGLFLATVAADWTAQQARQINWAQSADTLLLFHPDFTPLRVKRGTDETVWTYDAAPLINVPVFDFGAVTPTGTMTPSAATGAITLTASAPVFTPAMVFWHLEGNGGRAVISAFTSATQVSAVVAEDFDDTTAFSDWVIKELVISTARGWPECGTFHQGRLWMGGLKSRPATFMASKVGDFFNFDATETLDDNGITATIDTDQVNGIHQMVSGRALQIFTSGGEFVVTGEPITPRTIGVAQQTQRGIERFVPTTELDGATLFLQRQGAALRQFLFVDVEQAWRTDLTSLLAPHLILAPIQMAARKTARLDDADRVLLVNGNGTMTVLTSLRAQEVTAFTRWETAGQVKSVASLLSGEVFFATLRDGTCRLEAWLTDRLLDASRRRTSTEPFQVMAGLDHLEGLEVDAIADGAYMGRFTVTGYSITLPREARDVEVGLPVDMRVETLPVEPRDASGPLIGRRSRIHRITARGRNCGTFTINGQPLVLRTLGTAPAAPLDTPPPVRSGDFILRGQLGWKDRHEVVISQPSPQPLEILGLAYDMRLSD